MGGGGGKVLQWWVVLPSRIVGVVIAKVINDCCHVWEYCHGGHGHMQVFCYGGCGNVLVLPNEILGRQVNISKGFVIFRKLMNIWSKFLH